MRRLLAPLFLSALLIFGCADSSDDTTPHSGIRELPTTAKIPSAQVHLSSTNGSPVLMSWIEDTGNDTHTLKFSTLDSGKWTPARQIASGDDWFVNWADFPSLIEVREDFWAAHWLQKSADSTYAYDVMLSISSDRGETWSAPFSPHDDGTKTEHGFVSLYPVDDQLGAVWLDGREMVDEHNHDAPMTLRSGRFDRDGNRTAENLIDERVCDCCQTDVATSGNDALLVYRDRSLTDIRDIYLASNEADSWSRGRVVVADEWHIDACPVNGPAIARNGNIVAIAWFTGADDQPRIRLARSADRGRSFSEATLQGISEPLGRVDVEVLFDGRVVVSWLERSDGQVDDKSSESQVTELRLQAFDRYGNAGKIIVVGTVPDAFLSGFPQMVRHNNELVLAWTSGDFDTSEIRSAIVPISML